MKTLNPTLDRAASATLSDQELFNLCREYGAKALKWRRKFIGLLPEVNRRKLYVSKGFGSIFEFAAKLCELSEEQVRLALNLEKRFEDKPALKALLANGEESINKLARVVSIATPENAEELAEKIKVLPKSALETWVRDIKNMPVAKSLPGQTSGQQKLDMPRGELRLSAEVQARLLELQEKGIDVNAMILEMLDAREEEIKARKKEIAEEIQQQAQYAGIPASRPASRYVPAKIRKILKQEHGTKCSIETCKRPAEVIHHTQRFALGRSHNPKYLAPLCKEHHTIAHSIDVKVRKAREINHIES